MRTGIRLLNEPGGIDSVVAMRRGTARCDRPCEKLLIAFRARAERPISSGLGVENRNEGTRNRGASREVGEGGT